MPVAGNQEERAAPRAEASALVVEGLTKRFGERVAYEDVSFEVGYGEVFGFLGPNGAGKTTMVRTLGTLLAPTSGSATVAGIELRAENGQTIRSRISIMPESPGLYLRLTAAENLECFARLYRLADRQERIERALKAVNLTDRANDLCRSLSKGLRQRVALARALLSDPAVLFLDEPTSGLDPVATQRGPRAHQRAQGPRRDHLPDHPSPRGGRAALRPRRNLEHDAAPSRPPRRVARPRCSRGASRSACEPSSPIQLRCSPQFPGSRAGRRQPPCSYLLTVSDPDAAAPEVARTLVHAGRGHLLDHRIPPLPRRRLLGARRRRRGSGAAMSFSWARVAGIVQKELRDYRRNRFVIVTMAMLPLHLHHRPGGRALRHQGLGHELQVRRPHRARSFCTC